MSSYTIRPSTVISAGGGTTPSASASVLANLSDASDSTYVFNTGSKAIQWLFGLSAPTIPSTEFAARIGTSLRWKGNSAGQYYIGAAVYRAADSVPGSLTNIAPNNASAFTTTQLAFSPVNWSLAELATLRAVWFDGRTAAGQAETDIAELFATVYTLTKATATPGAKTENASVFPTIPVTVGATIDWEAATLDGQNLRKVTVEVRVESGSTGVGTGKLLSSSSASVLFTATGTQVVNVTMPDGLANGTYQVYARALRYREDGIAYADAYSDWSTAATLTMSAPLPAPPTITVAADNSSASVKVTVTPIATTNYLGPFIYLQRSDDLGATWVDVRLASGVAGTFGTPAQFIDYEAPRNTPVIYRAKIAATYSSSYINPGLWATSSSAQLSAGNWNLKHPLDPTKNALAVLVFGEPGENIEEDVTVFRPAGRKYPVVVAGAQGGWDGDIQIKTTTEADWKQLKALIESQAILRLDSAYGWSKYIRLLSPTSRAIQGSTTAPRSTITLKYVEIARPTVEVGAAGAVVIIPTLLDGGSASSTYDSFTEGGSASTAYLVAADGGTAAG